MKFTQTTGPTLEGQKPKERKNSTWSLGKGDLKHNKLQKIMKRQRNTTQMKEQTRNRSTNQWRGNMQTTWKRIQNNDSKDDQNPWKQKGENVRIN